MHGGRTGHEPMDVSFEVKDFHPVHFQSIVSDWVRGTVSTASQTGRITFDLPETLGTQCSVTLDLAYSILPYPVNCSATKGLVEDLKFLRKSYFEVMQLTPLDSLDLSLMYGVSIAAKAGLEGDIEQYREMQKLVGALWEFLRSEDVALVLQCIKDPTVKQRSTEQFYGDSRDELFILMAKIPKENKRTQMHCAHYWDIV